VDLSELALRTAAPTGTLESNMESLMNILVDIDLRLSAPFCLQRSRARS
jgi:hypothetical protein